jgi:hypothetical protein
MGSFRRSPRKLKRAPFLNQMKLEQMMRDQMMREPVERDPMKTLSRQAKQLLDRISGALADYRDAFLSRLRAAESKLFPKAVPVRVVNRPQKQSPTRRPRR